MRLRVGHDLRRDGADERVRRRHGKSRAMDTESERPKGERQPPGRDAATRHTAAKASHLTLDSFKERLVAFRPWRRECGSCPGLGARCVRAL